MSMMLDIAITITTFCKKNNLQKSEAVSLIAEIVSDLEWDFGEPTGETANNIIKSVNQQWEEE